MEKKYRVKLSVEERQELKAMVSRGRAAAYRQTHARILLLSDEAQGDGVMKDGDIARSLPVGRATVERVRRRWWRRVWRRPWDAGSNSIAVRRSWTVRGKPAWLPWPAPNRHWAG